MTSRRHFGSAGENREQPLRYSLMETGGDALHKMSCPPRARLTVTPYRTMCSKETSRACNQESGLEIRFNLSRNDTLRHFVPESLKPCSHGHPTRKQVLAGLVVVSRIALQTEGIDTSGIHPELMEQTRESLEDEYLENVVQLDPFSLGLPAFALASRARCATVMRPDLDPKRMLAVFSRTHAGLFVASRSPVLPDSEPEHDTSYLLYVPG